MTILEKVLSDYENKHYFLQNPIQLKSGKEATVYVVNFKGNPLALKVYKDPKFRAFQNTQAYLEGKYFRNPSERKAVQKRSGAGQKIIHKGWVRREFYLLKKLYRLGASVPRVYEWTDESVLMDFIGDEYVAPRLIDVELTQKQARQAFEIILVDIQLMLECGVVHSDLSPYNILWRKDIPWIIDFPQAIDVRQNPNKFSLLKRDLDNVIKYFEKYFEIDKQNIYQRLDLTD